MPGTTPPTSQLEWLSSTTAMIVLFWSRATRDLLRSFGWGIAALLRENAATKLPFHRRPPHSVFRFLDRSAAVFKRLSGPPDDGLMVSRPGTRSLNPSSSSGESGANLSLAKF